MIRKPVVAGHFYPASPSSLKAQIGEFIKEGAAQIDAIGVLSPHAGYVYSGSVAGAVLSRIKFGDTFVVLGPSHTGYGKPFSIMTEGSWSTPLGEVEVDSRLAADILSRSSHLEDDTVAHLYEHSIEVQLPILQYLDADFKIVPIVLSPASFSVYKDIGKDIAGAIQDAGSSTVIIASSDMTHYETEQSARKKDQAAIEAILGLDEDELMKRVRDMDISMCGYAPAVALVSAARELGAKRAELVTYRTSGDVSGDYVRVVGYAGIIIPR